MFVPDTDTGQYWWLKNTGASPEDMYIEEVCALLDERPKGCAVDVGANFGCWSMALAQHAHSVLAVEPQKVIHQLLRKSVKHSRLKNVRIFFGAAGDDPGTINIPALDINRDSNFGGVMVGTPFHDQADAEMTETRVRRLDDLLRGEQVSFIKIDVEGYEQKVLAGARETIMRCKPILFCEMDHPLTLADKLKEQIEKMGYATDTMGGNYLGMPI